MNLIGDKMPIWFGRCTYSCSKMVSGDIAGPGLGYRWGRGNLVLLRISATSQFRRTSSPSFSPEARCVHTKHRLVDAVVALP